jgi:hypothetical protein
MAGTSQQVKEWGRPAGPLQRDVGAALSALSEEDLLRLRAIARLRARSLPDGMSWSDLLHEAVLRALAGARPWPPGVPFWRASWAAFATSNGADTADRIICPRRSVVAGPTTQNGPARQRRSSPLFNGCSRPTRQH